MISVILISDECVLMSVRLCVELTISVILMSDECVLMSVRLCVELSMDVTNLIRL